MCSSVKAIAIDQYGGPEELTLRDLPTPKVGPDTILVRTHAAGVNPVDCKIRAGMLDERFPSHFPLIPGWDVAGVVEGAGPAVPPPNQANNYRLPPGFPTVSKIKVTKPSSGQPGTKTSLTP